MKKIVIGLLVMVMVSGMAWGQAAKDSLKRVEYRLGLETGVMSGWGTGIGYTGVRPELKYNINERFSIAAGGTVMSSWRLGGDYRLKGREAKSLVPRREGAVGYEVYVSGEWRVNERLTLGATVIRMGGSVESLWAGGEVPLDVTGVAADVRYRTKNGNLWGFHFSYLRDRTGALEPYLMWPYGDGMWGGYGVGYGMGMLGGGIGSYIWPEF